MTYLIPSPAAILRTMCIPWTIPFAGWKWMASRRTLVALYSFLLRGSLSEKRRAVLSMRRIELMANTKGIPARMRVTCSVIQPPRMGAMIKGMFA